MSPDALTHPSGDAVHVMFLLDRSGSMASITSDVIGGFNGFLRDQQAFGHDDCTMTVAQFDGRAPFAPVVVDKPLAEVAPLDAASYIPRATTPLYDAIDAAITHAERHAAQHLADHGREEDVIVVVMTDGLENASRRCTRQQVFARIATKQSADGWTFVFLGADQDAYATGERLGVHRGSTSGWDRNADGADAAFRSVSRGLRTMRSKPSAARRHDRDDFFDGHREAEQDSPR
ncbi:MAG: VWA domain-containing protein [Acidimicrobiia bacterium]|nr:VWA domain-containing protein [Acidimicrobiia bacterium]